MRPAGQAFFPLDERWELNDSVYSPALARQMVWLSGLLPYAEARQVFERIGHRTIPASSLWRQTQQHGQRLKQHLDHQTERVAPERVVLPPPGRDHAQRKGLSLDGGKLHVRNEGWKEFKVGAVYDVELRRELDPETGDEVEQAHGVNMAYLGVLGNADTLGRALWALAVAHDIPQAADLSVTADGAEWIWNLVADYFPQSVQIVDWYHACEHLTQAAQALYPDDDAAAQRWAEQRRHNLYLGALHTITAPLEQADLPAQARYFQTHQRRMQYQDFREQGYPIGSGTVESGIKRYKARLTGAGMRWSRSAAERMLVIRSAVLTGDFDALWDAARN